LGEDIERKDVAGRLLGKMMLGILGLMVAELF